MATTSGTGPSPGTSTVSSPSPGASSGILANTNPPQGAKGATSVVYVPVLHIVGSLPSPVADVAQILLRQHWQSKEARLQHFSILWTGHRRLY